MNRPGDRTLGVQVGLVIGVEIDESLKGPVVYRGSRAQEGPASAKDRECVLRRWGDPTDAPEAKRMFARERSARIGDGKDIRLFLPRAPEQLTLFTAPRIRHPFLHVARHVVSAESCHSAVCSNRFNPVARKVAQPKNVGDPDG